MMSEQLKFEGKTILIAEDEEANFRYLSETLKTTGAKVLRALNGEEVIQLVRENQIDLVLMDIKMPRMNGYEATLLIKETNPDIPVIAQTAYVLNSNREEVLNLGCDNFISKPIKADELLQMIQTYLG